MSFICCSPNVGSPNSNFFRRSECLSPRFSSHEDGLQIQVPRLRRFPSNSNHVCLNFPNSPVRNSQALKAVCNAYKMQSQISVEEELIHERPGSEEGSRGVPVFVMMPLDTVNSNGTLNRRKAMNASLLALKSAGVKGVMVDVWWGLVEKEGPGQYNWSGYKELLDMVSKHGLKLQAVMSFHQCGGNVGDSCNIPLPYWVVEEIKKNPDMVYTDTSGRRNQEYISLGCDTLPLLKGRSPIQVYADCMKSFSDTFSDFLGKVIVVSSLNCKLVWTMQSFRTIISHLFI